MCHHVSSSTYNPNTTTMFVLRAFIVLLSLTLCVLGIDRKCRRELEEIIYAPQFCAKSFFERLAVEFKTGGQAIFGSSIERDNYVFNFVNAKQVAVDLVPSIGPSTDYYIDGTKTTGLPPKYPDNARAYLNLGAYINYSPDQRLYYTFLMFSPDGQQYSVSLSIPSRNDPIICDE
jgi:hypothetical protein